jgi:hypothetical protein
MKHAFEMGSNAMREARGFKMFGVGILKSIVGEETDRKHGDCISLL